MVFNTSRKTEDVFITLRRSINKLHINLEDQLCWIHYYNIHVYSSPVQKTPDFCLHTFHNIVKKVKINSEKEYLKTTGDGTQNFISVFLTFSWSVDSSKHHEVCSLAEGPAVGSGAPWYLLMSDSWEDSRSSKRRWAVGKIWNYFNHL